MQPIEVNHAFNAQFVLLKTNFFLNNHRVSQCNEVKDRQDIMEEQQQEPIFLKHQEKMHAIEHARGQIIKLQQALHREPDNDAIRQELQKVTEISEPIDYLCTGITILNEYQNASSEIEKMELEKQFYEQALKQPLPPQFFQRWQHIIGPETSAYDCPNCKRSNSLLQNTQEGNTSCQSCGYAFQDGISSEVKHMSFQDRMDRNTSMRLCPKKSKSQSKVTAAASAAANKYKYECRSYMMERLAQVQAKETIRVSKEDMAKIDRGLIKYRHTGVEGWKPQEMKIFLNKLKLPHLYKHTNYLLCWLSKKPAPTIPKEVQKLLIEAFDQMAPYVEAHKGMLSDHRTNDRKSRPHYGYVCRQLLRLMGQDQFIELFPQLISTDKVLLYDDFWKKICEEMGWENHYSSR